MTSLSPLAKTNETTKLSSFFLGNAIIKKKAKPSSFLMFGISPLALAACGGGSSVAVSGDEKQDGTDISDVITGGEDSEVSINLQKGQFLVFHPDHTAHGTENVTEIPRNTFMLVVKRNEWIDSLVGQSHMEFINVDEMVADKAVAA